MTASIVDTSARRPASGERPPRASLVRGDSARRSGECTSRPLRLCCGSASGTRRLRLRRVPAVDRDRRTGQEIGSGARQEHGDTAEIVRNPPASGGRACNDALVQAAGVFPLAPFTKTAAAQFESTLQVNLLGPYRLAQPLAAQMRERGSGNVVTIGSVADRIAYPENVAYAASKFAAWPRVVRRLRARPPTSSANRRTTPR